MLFTMDGTQGNDVKFEKSSAMYFDPIIYSIPYIYVQMNSVDDGETKSLIWLF